MTALAACRFAHFIAAMLSFGASLFLCACCSDGLRRNLSQAVWRIVAASSAVALITAVLWLAAESASLSGEWSAAYDPSMIGAVLIGTAYGNVWAFRLVVAALLVAVVFGGRGRWGEAAISSAALLASLAMVGHATMHVGVEGVLQRVNHALHLLAAGAWLGGLIPFLMCVSVYPDPKRRADAVGAMARFSFWGQFNVAAIVVTGAVNIALISGHPPIPPSTPYRALLDAKIALVSVMIALALFNRFRLAPRLAPGAAALVALRLTSAAEVALGTVVVALVSVFAMLDPR